MPGVGTSGLPHDIGWQFDELQAMRKAYTETAVSAGPQLVRQDLSGVVAMEVNINTPIRNRLNRVKGNGRAHEWFQLTPTEYTEGNFMGPGPEQSFFENGGVPTEVQPTYGHVSAPYKAWGGLCTVSIQDRLQGASFGDLLAGQKRVKALNTAMVEEWCIINGNVDDNQYYFDGFASIIEAEADYEDHNSQDYPISQTCREAAISIRKSGGLARFLAWGFEVHERWLREVEAFYAVRQTAANQPMRGLAGGFDVDSWNFGTGKIDLIQSQFINTPSGYDVQTAYMIDDQSLDTYNTPNGNVVDMVSLANLEFIDLAMLQTAWRPLVFSIGVLKISAPLFQRKLVNLPAA